MGELADVTIGWREIVVAIIVLVAAYMLMVILRMQGLRRKATPVGVAPPAEPSAVAREPDLAAQAAPAPAVAEVAPAETGSWQDSAAVSAQPVFIQGVDAEVVQLRDEVDALRGELAALRDELHNELAHLRAIQTVSPLYSDAMQMATLGHDAAIIAERCGIARAEAELMVALVKNQEEGGTG